jgi:hypothetical protein
MGLTSMQLLLPVDLSIRSYAVKLLVPLLTVGGAFISSPANAFQFTSAEILGIKIIPKEGGEYIIPHGDSTTKVTPTIEIVMQYKWNSPTMINNLDIFLDPLGDDNFKVKHAGKPLRSKERKLGIGSVNGKGPTTEKVFFNLPIKGNSGQIREGTYNTILEDVDKWRITAPKMNRYINVDNKQDIDTTWKVIREVPGPLPALGLVAAFSSSRNLRRRIKSSS